MFTSNFSSAVINWSYNFQYDQPSKSASASGCSPDDAECLDCVSAMMHRLADSSRAKFGGRMPTELSRFLIETQYRLGLNDTRGRSDRCHKFPIGGASPANNRRQSRRWKREQRLDDGGWSVRQSVNQSVSQSVIQSVSHLQSSSPISTAIPFDAAP